MAIKTLKNLKDEHLERVHWKDLFTVGGEDKDHAVDVWDDAIMAHYFQHFVPPGPCIQCGKRLTGGMLEAALGLATFEWGYVHGEGHCSNCGYPARAYHRDV